MASADMTDIDAASRIMSEPTLNNVMAQYFSLTP